MTSVRETRPRAKPARRSRRRSEDAALLDPLAPPDVFAPLATDRLILRPLVPEDADALHRLVNDWEVARNLAVVPFPYPRKLADDWIQSTRRSLADGSGYQLAITGREGPELGRGRIRASMGVILDPACDSSGGTPAKEPDGGHPGVRRAEAS